LKNKR